MKSQNFEFIRNRWPELAALGGFAEAYAYTDPTSSLVKLRGFAESLTKDIYLLSDLELAAFFLFDWNPTVTDIREQYPLRLDDTRELATQAGIREFIELLCNFVSDRNNSARF